MNRRDRIRQKIRENVKIEDRGHDTPCHIWQGGDSGTGRGGGYPRMSLDGQTVAVHIVSFVNEHGYVPGKKQVDHLCNQRMCCNPDHLEMVTHKQNQKRKALRASTAFKKEVPCVTSSSTSWPCSASS